MQKIFVGITFVCWAIGSFAATGNEMSAFFEGLMRNQKTVTGLTDKPALFEKNKKNTIPQYREETALICAWTAPISRLTQLAWDIIDNHNTCIGTILVQYYPEGDCTGYPQGTPLIRLRNITITDLSQQRKGHGSRALETLFTVLRGNKSFPEETLIGLEYSTLAPHLGPWYEKFGFKKIGGAASWSDVSLATVPLRKIKFPYYKALKLQGPKKTEKA